MAKYGSSYFLTYEMSKREKEKRHMKVAEMNRKHIKTRLKKSTYIMTDLDLTLLNDGEYKSNIKMNNKKYRKKEKKKPKVDVLNF